MLNNTDTINTKIIDPLSATQTRRFDWEAHFRKASYESQQTSHKRNDGILNNDLVKNYGYTNKSAPGYNHRQISNNVTNKNIASDHSIGTTYASNLHIKSVSIVYANATNIAESYQSQRMKHIAHIERNAYMPIVRPKIMVRLLKMAEGSYRLGVIVYGATQSMLMDLRNLVTFMTSRKGKIISGYVNGVNCTGDEES